MELNCTVKGEIKKNDFHFFFGRKEVGEYFRRGCDRVSTIEP